MLEHKTSLNKFKKFETKLSIFSDHNTMKLEINHKKKPEKHTNTWKLNDILLNNVQVKKIKEETKRYLETNENEDTTIQKLWDTGKAILSGKFIALQTYLKNKKKLK